jgi:hypothetical protein
MPFPVRTYGGPWWEALRLQRMHRSTPENLSTYPEAYSSSAPNYRLMASLEDDMPFQILDFAPPVRSVKGV